MKISIVMIALLASTPAVATDIACTMDEHSTVSVQILGTQASRSAVLQADKWTAGLECAQDGSTITCTNDDALVVVDLGPAPDLMYAQFTARSGDLSLTHRWIGTTTCEVS